jgi:hypothetical protein
MEYTFFFSHRSGKQYLVSVDRESGADLHTGEWRYRWRDRTDGSAWVEWDTLEVPPHASLEAAVTFARQLMARLWQPGAKPKGEMREHEGR